MRVHFFHLCRVMFFPLVAILSAGCYTVHQGQFVADQPEGWRMRQAEGYTYFHYPTKHTPDWNIGIGGADHDGQLHLHIGSDAYNADEMYKFYKLLSFSGSPIRVRFPDHTKETLVPTDRFQTNTGQDLYIGSSQEVTVIIPSFKIGTNVVPELPAHMHWSNGKYHVHFTELM